MVWSLSFISAVSQLHGQPLPTIAQGTIIRLRVERDLDHLTPPTWSQYSEYIAEIRTPPTGIYPSSYEPGIYEIVMVRIKGPKALNESVGIQGGKAEWAYGTVR
jgi:hypothetical protein